MAPNSRRERENMDAVALKFASGVLTSLIGKIGSLLEQEYALLAGVRRDIRFVRDELRSMEAFLHALADRGEPDKQVQEWTNQVRELAYDVEDSVDDFMRSVDRRAHPRGPDGLKGFLRRAAHLVRTLTSRHRIAAEIQDLKARALEVSERRGRYKLGEAAGPSGTPAVDPRLAAFYADAASLVGIDGPRGELVRLVLEGARERTGPRKVVPVVGFGGVGKTTLAMEVCREVGDQFDCRAVAAVSQNLDMRKLLRDLLSQLEPSKEQGTDAWDKERLIHKLRAFLHDKRYFIVIDDIWSATAWENIKCALPDNNHGSRIIITTRINGVAKSCCSCLNDQIFEMKPLCQTDAEELFFKRIFGSRNHCPVNLEGVWREILKKCGGVPLAINSIASLLATKLPTKEEWEKVKNSIGSAMENDSNLEGMKQVLSLSYNDLPCHLKTCLLYLSIFPEDCKIQRSRLVRRWISEGLIHEERGLKLEETAENYFHELINRAMIQPVGLKYDGRVSACRVHDIMLDLIKSKSTEENFVTILCGRDLKSEAPGGRVRRLSIHQIDPGVAAAILTSMSLSHTRSLSIFQPALGSKPPFQKLKLLRVLDLEGYEGLDDDDVKDICKLSLLKFLSLRGVHRFNRIPAQIGHLVYLETLDLRGNGDLTLPIQVSQLQRLRDFRVLGTELPQGIGKMSALERLIGFNINRCSPSTVRELGMLTRLRELRVWWYPQFASAGAAGHGDALLASLIGLCGADSDLRRLHLMSIYVCSLEFLAPWPSSPRQLRQLRVRDCYFPTVPPWIETLENLADVLLWVHEIKGDAMRVLQRLPSLLRLHLKVLSFDQEERIVVAGGGVHAGFQALEEFSLECRVLCLVFEPEAMPRLRRLYLKFDAPSHGAISRCGIEHLWCLEQLKAEVNCWNVAESDVEAAAAAMSSAASDHPNRPKLSIMLLGA